MTENGKTFLEIVSTNETLREELINILKDVKIPEQMPLLIDFAKKNGYELTEEDLQLDDQKIDLAELDAVTGGGGCGCPFFGVGRGDSLYCKCFGAGTGFVEDSDHPSQGMCICVGAGAGATRRH